MKNKPTDIIFCSHDRAMMKEVRCYQQGEFFPECFGVFGGNRRTLVNEALNMLGVMMEAGNGGDEKDAQIYEQMPERMLVYLKDGEAVYEDDVQRAMKIRKEVDSVVEIYAPGSRRNRFGIAMAVYDDNHRVTYIERPAPRQAWTLKQMVAYAECVEPASQDEPLRTLIRSPFEVSSGGELWGRYETTEDMMQAFADRCIRLKFLGQIANTMMTAQQWQLFEDKYMVVRTDQNRIVWVSPEDMKPSDAVDTLAVVHKQSFSDEKMPEAKEVESRGRKFTIDPAAISIRYRDRETINIKYV